MTRGSWGGYAKSSDGVYVNKDDWAQRGVIFYITGVELRAANGKYGAEWELTVSTDEAAETLLTFAQSTGSRDEAMTAAKADLDSGAVTEVGPIFLYKTKTRAGNTFYSLEDGTEDAQGAPGATETAAVPAELSTPIPGAMP